ncbi:MAG: GtrA family protein [Gaiellaceae bacterium]
MFSEAVGHLRSAHNWRQLAKYCVVGVVGSGINVAIYDTLIHHGLSYRLAATAAFPVGVTANYVLNRYWTFRDQRGRFATQGVRFFVVALAALGLNVLLLDLLIRAAGVEKLPAQVVAIVILTPLNFISNKFWSFRNAPAPS